MTDPLTSDRLERLRMWAQRCQPDHPGRRHDYDGACPWCRTDSLPMDDVWDGNAHDVALLLLDEIADLAKARQEAEDWRNACLMTGEECSEVISEYTSGAAFVAALEEIDRLKQEIERVEKRRATMRMVLREAHKRLVECGKERGSR